MSPDLKRLARRLLSKRVTPHYIWAGPLRGRKIMTSWHDYPAGITGRTERQLLSWFETSVRSGETWLDIGAHYGYTSLAISEIVGSAGRVFSFEPYLASAGHLCQTKLLNNVPQMRVIPFGLGEYHDLRVGRLGLVRGMLDSQLEGADAELYFETAIDWLWPIISEGSPAIHGAKIDVQGMEIAVLKGMQGLLAQWRPKLALEFHEGVDRETVLGLLDNAGYQLPGTAIEPSQQGLRNIAYLDNRSYAFQVAL